MECSEIAKNQKKRLMKRIKWLEHEDERQEKRREKRKKARLGCPRRQSSTFYVTNFVSVLNPNNVYCAFRKEYIFDFFSSWTP